jgi:uncharacterized protein YoxC
VINQQRYADAIAKVGFERHKQEQMKAAGKFRHTCNDPQMTDPERLAVLVEEVGEVSTEVLGVCDEADARAKTMATQTRENSEAVEQAVRVRMYEELAQVAAVAVAWMESIEIENALDAAEGQGRR